MISDSVLLSLQRATHRTLHTLTTTLATTQALDLTGVLDRLERRDHITRELDPSDRRSFRITLTASGRAVARKITTAITDLEATALAGLSARQLAGYHAVIAALQEIP